MARPDFLSPLHLYASVAPNSAGLNFDAAGDELSPEAHLLLNPNKSAMLIDQFRFSGAAIERDSLNLWDLSYLGVDLRLGSIPLTNGVVPIASLAPRYLGFPLTPSALVMEDPLVWDAVMTWHLPRPLYVPPGVQLYARFVRQDIFPANNRDTSITNISFSAVGRSMPQDYPIPKKIWTPWATATQCKTTGTRFVSGDQDLANPNTELLHVTSFVGYQCNQGVTPSSSGAPTPCPLTIQMTLSSGKMLMRDPTPFFALFPSDRGALNVDAVLQSKEFVRAELELTPVAGATARELQIAYATVGMIGYREVQTPIGVQP